MALKECLDNRIGGRIRYVFLEEGEPLGYVPSEIRQCVVFLGYQDGTCQRVVGSAFWIVNSKHGYGPAYLVTAAHVLREIRKHGQEAMIIRENFSEGADWKRGVCLDRWRIHPDKTVDVAMLKIPITGQHAGWPTSQFLTQETSKACLKYVDLGDEIFFPGMFWPHRGSERNIPIVRIGNIAGLREEKVWTGDEEHDPMDVYLVECRSVGGLSGSPVFMDVIAARLSKEINPDPPPIGWERFKMIGMMNGHFTGTESEGKSASLSRVDLERLNMGMAFVTPAEKILEVMELFAEEEENELIEFNKRRRDFVAFDSAPNIAIQTTPKGVEIPTPSKEQFFDDLKKATRKKD